MRSRETMANKEVAHDLTQILSSNERNFLIRNSNEQIPVDSLVGKIVGLYFAGSWLYECKFFTEKLEEIYGKLVLTESNKFEVVYISSDESEQTFSRHYPKMPWLAIPFSDSETRERLKKLFMISKIPKLVILDANGKVTTHEGAKIVLEYGEHGFPFTYEKIQLLKEREREENEWQTLGSIFGSTYFFISNDRTQTSVDYLFGKTVGLYFAGSSYYACRCFTPKLVELYKELRSKGNDFEVVYISSDENEGPFSEYYSEMPWLTIPFSDSETRKRLKEIFKIVESSPLMKEIRVPKLVIFDANGKLTTDEGKEVVLEYGADGYPFTSEKINTLNQNKQNQTLSSIFASTDFLFSNNGNKVPVSELENKTVALYFFNQSDQECHDFDQFLLETLKTLKENGLEFEVILISKDRSETQFKEGFAEMPCFSLPSTEDNYSSEILTVHFKIRTFPGLVIIGRDGKTLIPNALELITEHGSRAYPFTPEKLAELDEQLREQQTLKYLLVSKDRDFVIDNSYSMKKVSELLDGKHILLFFSASYTEKLREEFLETLLTTYMGLRRQIEVIFVSCDIDRDSFATFFSQMPWYALPYDDEKTTFLLRWFGIEELPRVVVLGPNGRTVTTEALEIIKYHMTTAYPFHEEHLEKLREDRDVEAREWPEKLKCRAHPHELDLTYKAVEYQCFVCSGSNFGWFYNCGVCNLQFDPVCARAFQEEDEGEDNNNVQLIDGIRQQPYMMGVRHYTVDFDPYILTIICIYICIWTRR